MCHEYKHIKDFFSTEYLLRKHCLAMSISFIFHSSNREMNPIHVEEWIFERFPIRVLSWRCRLSFSFCFVNFFCLFPYYIVSCSAFHSIVFINIHSTRTPAGEETEAQQKKEYEEEKQKKIWNDLAWPKAINFRTRASHNHHHCYTQWNIHIYLLVHTTM